MSVIVPSTNLLQCVGISRARVQDVHAEGDARQQNGVPVDRVYGEQHGLQSLDASIFIDAAALLHTAAFLMHGEQAAQHQVAFHSDLPPGRRRVSDGQQHTSTHHHHHESEGHHGWGSGVGPGEEG